MIEQGLSEALLGVLNAIGSVVGIIGACVYPILVKRTGLVRTGVIGFWSEFSMLIICLLSLFVPGSSFSPTKNFTIGLCNLHETTNHTSTMNPIPFYCSTSKLSALMLVIGIILNRFGKVVSQININFFLSVFIGVSIADLTVNQLQQERVPEDVRGRVGGIQESFNQFFYMLHFILIIILPEMSQFGYHVCLSALSVFTASLIYTIWSCSTASQVVPPAADIDINEVNTD